MLDGALEHFRGVLVSVDSDMQAIGAIGYGIVHGSGEMVYDFPGS